MRTPTHARAVTPKTANVADRLALHAAERPDETAVVAIRGGRESRVSFRELNADASLLARGLVACGVEPGLRMALLVKPGVEFVTLVFALLRSGATMVLVDSGLGRKNIVRCLESTHPDGFVAIERAHLLRELLFWKFWNAKINIQVGPSSWWWPVYRKPLSRARDLGRRLSPSLPATHASDPAAVVFTSGSTGPPKGVLYTHETFVTQCDEIQRRYGLQPGAVDLACFPLFGLFGVACGVTTVLPEMDFSRPAACDPPKLFAAANKWRVTQSFASPAVWARLSRHAEQAGQSIPTLRKVFSCGAPVPAGVIRRTLAMVRPGAELHTPYGATEALPVATIEAEEILEETAAAADRGAGVCVGRKFDTIEWRVIKITDGPIATIEEADEAPPGEIGELIVRGPQVSNEYLVDGEAQVTGDDREPADLAVGGRHPPCSHNQLAKIADGDATWHRMGDVGCLDEHGRFWYCGRKSQRVAAATGVLFTIPVESIFDTAPLVGRTALVGVPRGLHAEPVIIYERPDAGAVLGRAGGPPQEELDEACRHALAEAAASHPMTRDIRTFLGISKLPTDIRHNAKIRREELAAWAAQQLKHAHRR